MSIVFHLEFVCTSSHHTCHSPHHSHFAPLRFAFRSISLAFSWSLVVWTTARGRGWFFLGFHPLPSFDVVHSSTTDQRCAFCPYHFRLCFAYLVDRRSSTQFILPQISSSGTVPSYLTYVCPSTLVFPFSPILYNSVVCGTETVCIHSCARLMPDGSLKGLCCWDLRLELSPRPSWELERL